MQLRIRSIAVLAFAQLTMTSYRCVRARLAGFAGDRVSSYDDQPVGVGRWDGAEVQRRAVHAEGPDVEIGAATGAANAWSRQPGSRRELCWLALTAAVLFADLAATVGYVGLLLERRDEFSLFAQFSGWQLYSVEVALAVLIVTIGGVAGRTLFRRYRELRGRTPHRRAVVLAALLPGLLAGVLAAAPMRAALSWASDHTAAAASARHKLEAWLADYRKAPPMPPSFFAAAPAALAARVLRPGDLGAGWYDGTKPNPTLAPVRSDFSANGELAAARAVVTQQHWTGQSWSLDHFVLESEVKFVSTAAATAYLKAWWHSTASDSACCSVSYAAKTSRHVEHALVWQRDVTSTTGTRREAAFTVGSTFFMLSFDLKPDAKAGSNAYEPVLRAAVARAASTA